MATATYSSLVGIAVGGKYQIRRVLGIGGMGVVCEAMHLDLGKRVAIKLIDKSMKESELIVTRFRREAWAASQIESEHIVDVFDVGADARVGLYMVMEHLSGEDLETRNQRERVDVRTAVMIGHQVARGLAKAHAAGVIHRDLKPANIFLTQRDSGQLLVKILDFGVSKLLGDEAYGPKITGSGSPVGTPLYMSPEQAEGQDDCDGRADIWSLGAVMYETLSGKSAFPDRGSYHGTLVGILTTKPEPLSVTAPWVPTALARVVDDMLVHDRGARIPDAQTVTQRLMEAFPAVMPDGTGRHTAVIVSAAADEQGDTEVFTADSMPAELLRGARGATGPSEGKRTVPDDEDSKRTLPRGVDTPSAPPVGLLVSSPPSGDPIGARPISSHPSGAHAISSQPSGAHAISSHPAGAHAVSSQPGGAHAISGHPSGAHAVSGHPISSAAGVAMPLTPPPELGPPSAVPDTVRDLRLAKRAARLRALSLAGLLLLIAGIALASYVAGQRAPRRDLAAPPPSATALEPPTTPSPPPTAPAPQESASAAP